MLAGKFNILFDSSWGSSAKGAAAARLADIYKIHNASTCNFPNAGHTVIPKGEKFVFKVLPSPAALCKFGHQMKLWIGPNSGFFVDQLIKEVEQTDLVNRGSTLEIHDRAIVVDERHKNMEAPGGSQSTLHISSTMSGSGAAYAEKAMRSKEVRTYNGKWNATGTQMTDFFDGVHDALKHGQLFLHEVSQGWALSVNCGTHYPNCTFRDCTPQQACADFCITPNQVGDVYMNVRSYPIRVGNNYDNNGSMVGYSGDFLPDQKETNWEEIGRDAEMPEGEINALAERERTTVTKKIRRVATQSWSLIKRSARLSGATKIILNFPQYLHWSAHKVRGGQSDFRMMHPKVREYVDKLEDETQLPVCMIGTGADHEDYVWLL